MEVAFQPGVGVLTERRHTFAGQSLKEGCRWREARVDRGRKVCTALYEPGALSLVGVPSPKETGEGVFLGYNWKPVTKEIMLKKIEDSLGTVPADFPEGMFLRNGPNPFTSPKRTYGWFDGSGMIHSVRFQKDENGEMDVYYSNRWIKTGYVKISDLLQRPLVNVTVQKGWAGFGQVLTTMIRQRTFSATEYLYGPFTLAGTANTAVHCFPIKDGDTTRKSILALYDSDSAYEIRLSKNKAPILQNVLGTAGYNPFGLDHPMTPHPRYDSETGEVISFGVGMPMQYFLRKSTPVVFINEIGEVYRRTTIQTRDPVYNHDFLITENFVILMDHPCIVNPFSMVLKPTSGTPIGWDYEKNSSFVLLPRTKPDNVDYSAGAEILFGDGTKVNDTKDFPLGENDSCFVMHFANAWEEDDKIIMYGAHYREMDVLKFNSQFPPPPEDLPTLYQFVIDLKTGQSSKKRVFGTKDAMINTLPKNMNVDIDAMVIDFCNASVKKSGRKSKYLYMCYTRPLSSKNDLMSPEDPEGKSLGNWEGFLKLNVETNEVEAIQYPTSVNGGECIFQPKTNGESEDDGWILTHVTRLEEMSDGSSEYVSYAWIIDAKNMNAVDNSDSWLPNGVVYSAKLPSRVPWGLHSTFFSDEVMAPDYTVAESII